MVHNLGECSCLFMQTYRKVSNCILPQRLFLFFYLGNAATITTVIELVLNIYKITAYFYLLHLM